MSFIFYKEDCLKKLKELPDKSIDFVYFNPPFGTTQQDWDEKLPFDKIIPECFRVLKQTGTLAIHCSIPFNYTLIRDAPKPPSYSWYWIKENSTTPLLAKRQPLRNTEEVLVWLMSGKSKYNPQRIGDEKRTIKSDGTSDYVKKCGGTERKEVIGKYQTHLISMPRTIRGFATRPDELIELFIKSYTDENDTILDPTCYKGLTGIIANKLKRNYIGIDKYFEPKVE